MSRAVVGGLAPPLAEDEERQQIEAQQQVIFVLESAQLEVAQVGKVRRQLIAGGHRHREAGYHLNCMSTGRCFHGRGAAMWQVQR